MWGRVLCLAKHLSLALVNSLTCCCTNLQAWLWRKKRKKKKKSLGGVAACMRAFSSFYYVHLLTVLMSMFWYLVKLACVQWHMSHRTGHYGSPWYIFHLVHQETWQGKYNLVLSSSCLICIPEKFFFTIVGTVFIVNSKLAFHLLLHRKVNRVRFCTYCFYHLCWNFTMIRLVWLWNQSMCIGTT